ncbi:MAG TPA: hypothetical protein VMT20_24925 [Terriglobia bacterium]|nr:hypothetical protein [Terriglobia bacterium]
MKHRYSCDLIYCSIAALGLLSAAYLAGAPGKEPVYIRLFAEATDHVNLDITENRLRRVLPGVEALGKTHPEAHVSATILFSGAVSQALEERNAQTHILDFVKDYIRRGVIEAGYDGTDEPTYDRRPFFKFSENSSPQDRWRMRETTAAEFLAEARDPLTGEPTGGTGGLKKMQEVLGPAAYIRGVELAVETYHPAPKVKPNPNALGAPVVGASFVPQLGIFRESGGDTETLQVLRQYNTSAVMLGIPAANPGLLPGFAGATRHFGEIMSPEPDTAPEVYWQDYVLRISEAVPPVHWVAAVDGVEALKAVLDKANRSTVQVVQVRLGAVENYLQPSFAKTAPNAPMKYAYDHPQSPNLPADAIRSKAEITAGWARENEVLKWLTKDYFPNNPGSRFVSTAALSKMAGAGTGFRISTESLLTQVSAALKKMGNDTHPFDYLEVDGHYLSLAELFQVLTDELAAFHETGKLPESVQTVKVYGPFRLVTGHGPNAGEVTSGDIERYCAEMAGPLHDDSDGEGVPKNSIPPLLNINGLNLNPAQMLRLMGLALANPSPETKLPVRMLYLYSEAGTILPKTRPLWDTGFVWTVKPAPLSMPSAARERTRAE